MRHWLHAGTNYSGYGPPISQTLSMEVEPSADGVHVGQSTWYSYDGMQRENFEGTNSLPSVVTRWPDYNDYDVRYTKYQRDSWGRPTVVTDSYSTAAWPPLRL
jgi:hypothetical protein